MPFATPAREDAYSLRMKCIKNYPRRDIISWLEDVDQERTRFLCFLTRLVCPSLSLTVQVMRPRCQTGCSAHWLHILRALLFFFEEDYPVPVWVGYIVFLFITDTRRNMSKATNKLYWRQKLKNWEESEHLALQTEVSGSYCWSCNWTVCKN